MNSRSRIVKTTGIYFIGNFASRILAFILLPIYASYLNADSFGTVDLIISILPLIAPIFTLQSTETVFRFICGENSEKVITKNISNALATYALGLAGFSAIYFPVYIINRYNNCLLLYFYFILTYGGIFLQQIARGINKNKEYAIAGVISTIVQAGFNIVLIVNFKMQAESLLISAIAASIIISVFLIFILKVWKFVDYRTIKKEEIRKQLKYGIPLVPNQICWWANSALCKFLLLYYHGTSATGLFAFAGKFPNLITTINSIFLLAFVENLIIENKSGGMDVFFSKSFKLFFMFESLIIAFLLPITKVYIHVTISNTYSSAIEYIPVLYVGTIFSFLATMLGSVYTTKMKTINALLTTLISAFANLICGCVLIPKLGVMGVALANSISAFVYMLIRVISVKKIIIFKIKVFELIPTSAILISTLFLYYLPGVFTQILVALAIGVVSLYIYRMELKGLLEFITKKLKMKAQLSLK